MTGSRRLVAGAVAVGAIGIAAALDTPTDARAPQRIVTLTPFTTNTLARLRVRPAAIGQTVGGGDRIAPNLQGVRVLPLSHPNGPNMEQLAALNPGLVLSSPTWRKGAQMMRRLDIRVVESDPRRVSGVARETRRIGALVGRPRLAAEVARRQVRAIARVKRRAKTRPRVMVVLGVGRTPFVFLPNSWGGDIVERAGGRLLTAGRHAPSGFARISDETVVARNPQIIIAVPHGRPGAIPKIADYLNTNPAWRKTSAARRGRIYVATDNTLLQAYPDVAQTIRRVQARFLKNTS